MKNHEVRKLRREVEMTQEEFAHFLGVASSTVRNWESGRSPVSELLADGIRARIGNITPKEAA